MCGVRPQGPGGAKDAEAYGRGGGQGRWLQGVEDGLHAAVPAATCRDPVEWVHII